MVIANGRMCSSGRTPRPSSSPAPRPGSARPSPLCTPSPAERSDTTARREAALHAVAARCRARGGRGLPPSTWPTPTPIAPRPPRRFSRGSGRSISVIANAGISLRDETSSRRRPARGDGDRTFSGRCKRSAPRPGPWTRGERGRWCQRGSRGNCANAAPLPPPRRRSTRGSRKAPAPPSSTVESTWNEASCPGCERDRRGRTPFIALAAEHQAAAAPSARGRPSQDGCDASSAAEVWLMRVGGAAVAVRGGEVGPFAPPRGVPSIDRGAVEDQ